MNVKYNPVTHEVTLNDGDDHYIYLTLAMFKAIGVLLTTMEKREVKTVMYELTPNGWSEQETEK